MTALALSPNFAQDQTLFAIFGGSNELHKSTDGGQHWQRYRVGSEEYFNGFELTVSLNYVTDQTLFATGFGTIHRSTDGGATWARTAAGLPGFYEPFVRVVAVSPHYAQVQTLFTALSGQLLGTPTHALIRSYERGASCPGT